ncbi:unnamed protein product [Candidula unifasciata]|uniref:CWH43-like N-terminal domain-containing protein n=1 Tax=Candidula unifasciata TaxID=100452 RepID=A0A8S3Z2K6_9EUPU|nr:unnamed protein product [Candidula unifasciata]
MGTDGEQPFTLTYSGQSDGLTGSEQGQIELLPVEILTEVRREEAVTLMGNGVIQRETSKGNCLQKVLQLRFLPILTFAWNCTAFVTSYAIAVSKGHVEPDFPYISHTAVEVPERGIFSQMVNLGALMFAANMYIKYLQVKAVILTTTSDRPRDRRLNIASLVVGFTSAVGMTVVANFQTRVMREAHYTGAFLAFTGGMIYCWLQTSLSLIHRPWSKITVFQITNSILLTIFLFMFGISKIVFKNMEAAGHGTKHDTLRDVYLVSTSTEWLTAIFTITYVLTYYRDFSFIRFNFPSVHIRNEQNPSSSSGHTGRVDV